MKKLNAKDWFKSGRWVQPPLSGTFWSYWHKTKSVEELFGKQSFHYTLWLDGHHFLHQADRKIFQNLAKEVLSSKNNIEKFISLLEKVGTKYEKRHLALIKNNKLNFPSYLKELFASYQELLGVWWITIPFGDELESYLIKQKLISANGSLLDKMTGVYRPTLIEQQSIEIKELTNELIKLKPNLLPSQVSEDMVSKLQIYSKIELHIKDFSWYGTHHWMGESYTIETCLINIQDSLKSGSYRDLPKRKKENDPFVNLFAALTYWRLHCAEVTAKVVFMARPNLEALAKQWYISYDQLLYLSHHEIIDLLNLKRSSVELPAKFSLRKRKWGTYLDVKDKEHIVIGKEVDQLLKQVINLKEQKQGQLKGIVASKGGIIKGIAKVLIAPEDFKKFKKGDILIAPETTPDFVPYMKMAAAIITDRGGITSHAAIVSRELSKPCIIGTKIATQVLKDGDQVEVDAKKATVKIIKKA